MFVYDYLGIGVPVKRTIEMEAGGGWLVSVERGEGLGGKSTKGWLRVESKDHLDRCMHDQGLREKLERFLRTEVRSIFPVCA